MASNEEAGFPSLLWDELNDDAGQDELDDDAGQDELDDDASAGERRNEVTTSTMRASARSSRRSPWIWPRNT
ncbi:Os12g0588400 [Oryza sativa Japonica Group]|uniref:Os12g0588400 protein n=2 Tax=Oryza sativa subsp. japonica TaxID=39947 RepID=C7J9K2_ORYSJ|nr:Os12g0588400 [Oryza sativa Japonica Group]BAT17863.1 Os12g0588400 [Oryza sativa Japonica Group]|eukprot:NP_001177035.1 Os12g0588400 [Oryza sativa Japonica Group]